MQLFNFLKRRETKSSRSSALLVPFGEGEAKFTPRQYDQLAAEGFQRNVIAYRCIRLVSQNAAAVPCTVFKGKGRHKTRVDDHALLRLLKKPNPVEIGASLFEAIYGFYLIAGNAMWRPWGRRTTRRWSCGPCAPTA